MNYFFREKEKAISQHTPHPSTMTKRNRPSPIVLPRSSSFCGLDAFAEPQEPKDYSRHQTDYFKEHILPIIRHRSFDPHRKAVEIVDGIWLGNATDAMDLDTLKTHEITSVVNCAHSNTLTSEEYYPKDWNYMGLACDDSASYDILGKHLDEFSNFMDKCAREKKPVLVHCAAGINRSATLLVAYLVARRGMNLKDTISHCFQKRPIILTNESFVLSLIERFL